MPGIFILIFGTMSQLPAIVMGQDFALRPSAASPVRYRNDGHVDGCSNLLPGTKQAVLRMHV